MVHVLWPYYDEREIIKYLLFTVYIDIYKFSIIFHRKKQTCVEEFDPVGQ